MNADAFRSLFERHFDLNRRLWNGPIARLTEKQFRQKLGYSVGSVRNQAVHILNMDERWFCGLRGLPVPGLLNPVYLGTRSVVRARWDGVESDMRAYLAALRDDDLGRVESGYVTWIALFHVLNHGQDHRAQLRVMLAMLGLSADPEDDGL